MAAKPAFPVVMMAPEIGFLAFFETERTFTLRDSVDFEVGVLPMTDAFLVDAELRRWNVVGVDRIGFDGGWRGWLGQLLSRRRVVHFDLIEDQETTWAAVAEAICSLMERSLEREPDLSEDERADFDALKAQAAEAGGVGKAGVLLGFAKAGWGNWLKPGGIVGRLEFSCLTGALTLLIAAAIWLFDSGLVQSNVLGMAIRVLAVPGFFVWFAWVGVRLHAALGIDWRWSWLISPAVVVAGTVAVLVAKTAPAAAIVGASVATILLAILCLKKTLPEARRPAVQ